MLLGCIEKLKASKLFLDEADEALLLESYEKNLKVSKEIEASNMALQDYHRALFDELNSIRQQAKLEAVPYPESQPIPESQSALDAQFESMRDPGQVERIGVLYEKGNEGQAPVGVKRKGLYSVSDPFSRGGGILLASADKLKQKYGINNKKEFNAKLKEEGDVFLQDILGRNEAYEDTNEADVVVEAVNKETGRQEDASVVSEAGAEAQVERTKKALPKAEVRVVSKDEAKATRIVDTQGSEGVGGEGSVPQGRGTETKSELTPTPSGEKATLSDSDKVEVTDAEKTVKATAGAKAKVLAEKGSKETKKRDFVLPEAKKKVEVVKEEYLVNAGDTFEFNDGGTVRKGKVDRVRLKGVFFQEEGKKGLSFVQKVKLEKKGAGLKVVDKAEPRPATTKKPVVKATGIAQMPLEKFQQMERQKAREGYEAQADKKGMSIKAKATFVNALIKKNFTSIDEVSKKKHAEAVAKALKSGKAVPDEVLGVKKEKKVKVIEGTGDPMTYYSGSTLKVTKDTLDGKPVRVEDIVANSAGHVVGEVAKIKQKLSRSATNKKRESAEEGAVIEDVYEPRLTVVDNLGNRFELTPSKYRKATVEEVKDWKKKKKKGDIYAMAKVVESDEVAKGRLSELKGKPPSALAQNAEVELVNDYEVVMNAEATEFVRQVLGKNFPSFWGITLNPKQSVQLASALRKAVKRYRNPVAKANINAIAKTVEEATRKGDQVPILVYLPSVLTEERFHRLALVNAKIKTVEGLLTPKSQQKLFNMLPFGVRDQLIDQYGNDVSTVVNEAVAKLANGEIELGDLEADATFLLEWAEAYVKDNDIKTLEDFRELNDFVDAVLESLDGDLAKIYGGNQSATEETIRKRNQNVSKQQEQEYKDTVRSDEEDGTVQSKGETKAEQRERLTEVADETEATANEVVDQLSGRKPMSFPQTVVDWELERAFEEGEYDYVPINQQTTTELGENILRRRGERYVVREILSGAQSGRIPTSDILSAGLIIYKEQAREIDKAYDSNEDPEIIEELENEHGTLVRALSLVYNIQGRNIEFIKSLDEREDDVEGRVIRGRLKRIKDKATRQTAKEKTQEARIKGKKKKDDADQSVLDGSIITEEERRDSRKQAVELRQALERVKELEARLKLLEEERARLKRNQPEDFFTVKAKVDANFKDNEALLTSYFENLAGKFAMARATVDAKRANRDAVALPPRIKEALIEYSQSILMNRLFEPKVKKGETKTPTVPITLKEFDAELTKLSGGKLTEEQIKFAHTEALTRIKNTQRKAEAGMSELAKERLKHYRRAINIDKGILDISQLIVDEADAPTDPQMKTLFEKKSIFQDNKESIVLGAVAFAEGDIKTPNVLAVEIGKISGIDDPRQKVALSSAALALYNVARKRAAERLDEINNITAEVRAERALKVKEQNAVRRKVRTFVNRLAKKTVIPSTSSTKDRVNHLANEIGHAIKRLDRVQTGQAIVSLATNMTNEITAIGAGTIMGFENAVDVAFQKMGLKGGALSPESTEGVFNQLTLGLSMMGLDKNWLAPHRLGVINLHKNYQDGKAILDSFPEEFAQLFGDIIPDISSEDAGVSSTAVNKLLRAGDNLLRGAESMSQKLLILNFWLEYKNRAAVFVHSLRTRVDSRGGLTLDEMIETGNYSELKENDFEVAIKRALKVTYADNPSNRTWGTIVHTLQNIPLVINPMRFARVAYNLAEFGYSRFPLYTIPKNIYKYTYSAKTGGVTSEDMAKMVGGFVISGIAMTLRLAFGGETDKWYHIRVPFTDSTIDVRRYQPFAMYYFLADRAVRAAQGKPVFDLSWDELAEAVVPINLRFYNPFWELMVKTNLVNDMIAHPVDATTRFGKSALAEGAEVLGHRDWSEQLKKEYEANDKDFAIYDYHIKRFWGGNVATFLNMIGNIHDLTSIALDDQTMPDQRRSPFWGSIERELPLTKIGRAFGYKGGVPLVEDPITGEPKKFGSPVARTLGFDPVPESILNKPKTDAEFEVDRLSNQFFPRPDLPAEEQKNMAINQLITAKRVGYISDDLFKQRLNYYTENGFKDRDGKPASTPLLTSLEAAEAYDRGVQSRLNYKARKLTYDGENSDFMSVYNKATKAEKGAGLTEIKIEKEAGFKKEQESTVKALEALRLMKLADEGKTEEFNQGLGKLNKAQQTLLRKKISMSKKDLDFLGKSSTEKLHIFSQSLGDDRLRYFALMQTKSFTKPSKSERTPEKLTAMKPWIEYGQALQKLKNSNPKEYDRQMQIVKEVRMSMVGIVNEDK